MNAGALSPGLRSTVEVSMDVDISNSASKMFMAILKLTNNLNEREGL